MADVLEIVGLLALVTAGFLVAMWLGFGVLGGACLWVSWSQARAKRLAAQVEHERQNARRW